MARPVNRSNCKTCDRHVDEVGRLSWTQQCPECGKRNVDENIVGLATHSGPAFQRWRRAMAASVGGSLDEDRAQTE